MCLLNSLVAAVCHCVLSAVAFVKAISVSGFSAASFRRIAMLASRLVTVRRIRFHRFAFQEYSGVSRSWSINGDSKIIGFRTSAPVCIASIL